MTRAILIHFLGFYAVNSLMPSWVVMADADILSAWYGSFALIDLIAIISMSESKCSLSKIARFALGTSCIWSALIAAEMLMMGNLLQRADISMQRYFDLILGLTLVAGAINIELQRAKQQVGNRPRR